MKATIDKIGAIHHGVEGSDEYVRIRTEGAHTPSQVKDWLLKRVYRDTTQEAGGYFCHRVTVMGPHPYMEDEFVAIIHHQYDV